MTVMIGVDPHKGSHTAVAIDAGEEVMGQLRVRSGRRQVELFVGWADELDDKRVWAVEAAGGLGYLLSQQLVAAGETVLDVPPTLASRVRVLSTGKSAKNDPNDARSVAIAALRAPALAEVHREDHATVLRLLAKRHSDLGRLSTISANRLHALLCELVPGGLSKEMSPLKARAVLARSRPEGAAALERYRLAVDVLEDFVRLEGQLKASKRHLQAAVTASGSAMIDLYGVGPYVAAAVIGYTGDITRFRDRHHFAAYNGTAPIEMSSGGRTRHRLSRRGNRRINHAIHIVAVVQIRQPHSAGRAYYDRKRAEGKTAKEAIRALKRRISDVLYRQLVEDHRRASR
jgi:transposase